MDSLPTRWQLNNAMHTDSARTLRFTSGTIGAEPVITNRSTT
jgi:hypothetical protein